MGVAGSGGAAPGDGRRAGRRREPTSVAAASSASPGIALSGPPATTATLTALKTTFVEKTLQGKAGDVLGVFVTNKDGYAHAFDIDALGVHVALPADSTTFVAVRPTAARPAPVLLRRARSQGRGHGRHDRRALGGRR